MTSGDDNGSMGATDDLTPRQRKFVTEYLLSGNAGRAAIAAGYSERAAFERGHDLLKNPKIQTAMAQARVSLEIRTDITQERVLNELAILAFSDVGHYDVDELGNVTVKDDAPKGARRAISSIKRKTFTDKDGNTSREVEIKLWDKPGPLKLAGRHVGVKGFSDRVEVTTATDTPVTIVIAGSMPTAKESVTVTGETTTTADALMTYNRTKE